MQRFYGLTVYFDPDTKAEVSRSVYEVFINKDKRVVTKKIALQGPSSIAVGGELTLGSVLGILGNKGLQRFDTVRDRRVDEVNTVHWGGGSTSLVALFCRKDAALNCFKANNLKHWDQRFLDASINTIRKIEMAKDYRITLDRSLQRAVQENRLQQYLIAVAEERETQQALAA